MAEASSYALASLTSMRTMTWLCYASQRMVAKTAQGVTTVVGGNCRTQRSASRSWVQLSDLPADRNLRRALMADCMAAGAIGMSTGLVYEPARFASEIEPPEGGGQS